MTETKNAVGWIAEWKPHNGAYGGRREAKMEGDMGDFDVDNFEQVFSCFLKSMLLKSLKSIIKLSFRKKAHGYLLFHEPFCCLQAKHPSNLSRLQESLQILEPIVQPPRIFYSPSQGQGSPTE